MKKIINLSEFKKEKYKLHIPVGEILEYKHFNRIIINDEIKWFLNLRTGKEWGRKTLKNAMKDGVIQRLLTWISSTDHNDIYLEHISIIMGLKKNIKYDEYLNDISTYSLYYQVISHTYDISPKLKTFDEAFIIFKQSVMEFVYGTYNKK